jgi:hypothetical protein
MWVKNQKNPRNIVAGSMITTHDLNQRDKKTLHKKHNPQRIPKTQAAINWF